MNGTEANNAVEFQCRSKSWHFTAGQETSAQSIAFEPFADEHAVAAFLGIKPRRVLEMARRRLIPAHPLGGCRKTWRFRISEIDAHFSLRNEKRGPATIGLAVPVTQERKRIG